MSESICHPVWGRESLPAVTAVLVRGDCGIFVRDWGLQGGRYNMVSRCGAWGTWMVRVLKAYKRLSKNSCRIFAP